MPRYRADAERDGKRYAGIFEASSNDEARQKLIAQGFKVLSMDEIIEVKTTDEQQKQKPKQVEKETPKQEPPKEEEKKPEPSPKKEDKKPPADKPKEPFRGEIKKHDSKPPAFKKTKKKGPRQITVIGTAKKEPKLKGSFKVTKKEAGAGIALILVAFLFFGAYEILYNRESKKNMKKTIFDVSDFSQVNQAWKGQEYNFVNVMNSRRELGRNINTPSTNAEFTYIYFQKANVTFKVNNETKIIEAIYPGER